MTVAGPISDTWSGASGRWGESSVFWCLVRSVSVGVGEAGAERDHALLCDLERSQPLSGPQFPVSAGEFVEEANELLHMKTL